MANYCEVYQKRSSLILYILGSLIIILIGIFYMNNAVVLSDQCNPMRGCCFEDPFLYYVFGRGLLTYFGLCIVVFILMLIKPYRLFYMNDDGFWTKDYGFITWDNVTRIYMDNMAYQTVIFFGVKSYERLNLSLVQKLIKYFKKGDLYIELSAGYEEVNQVFKFMKQYCQYEDKNS